MCRPSYIASLFPISDTPHILLQYCWCDTPHISLNYCWCDTPNMFLNFYRCDTPHILLHYCRCDTPHILLHYCRCDTPVYCFIIVDVTPLPLLLHYCRCDTPPLYCFIINILVCPTCRTPDVGGLIVCDWVCVSEDIRDDNFPFLNGFPFLYLPFGSILRFAQIRWEIILIWGGGVARHNYLLGRQSSWAYSCYTRLEKKCQQDL